jgi:GT2 family glycosyltransferase
MNKGLLAAESEYVLFLDDDIIPCSDLVSRYAAALDEIGEKNMECIVGQVLQPGETVVSGGNSAGGRFKFNSDTRRFIGDVMAGNLCVHRARAIEIGGFDENFIGVAYRFESEFARRVILNGGKILFNPGASIRHLRAAVGGTRKYGNHLTSASPAHGVGDYYFALSHGLSLKSVIYILRRPFREVRTKFHLKHPWWIPVKFIGELRAIAIAIGLRRRGPRYIANSEKSSQKSHTTFLRKTV